MPEYMNIESDLQHIASPWREYIQQEEISIQDLKFNLNNKKIIYSEEIQQQKQEEINQKTIDLNKYIKEKFGLDGAYFQEQQKILKPLQQKIIDVLYKIANDRDYQYVLDKSSTEMIFFADPAYDLTEIVLKELEKDNPK